MPARGYAACRRSGHPRRLPAVLLSRHAVSVPARDCPLPPRLPFRLDLRAPRAAHWWFRPAGCASLCARRLFCPVGPFAPRAARRSVRVRHHVRARSFRLAQAPLRTPGPMRWGVCACRLQSGRGLS